MKITVITVGKIKEKFYRDAIDEYVKRLGKYSKIEILEASDEKTAEKMLSAGAHFIIEDISKVPYIIDIINNKLKNGERA